MATTEIITNDLPTGFETVASLLALDAGRAYAANRWVERDVDGAESIIAPEATRTIQTAEPAHPDCYIDEFADGSIYVHSNADDEVWAELSDYLSHYELELAEVDGSTVTRAI